MYCCVFYLCLRIKYLFLYFLLFAIIGVFLLNFCSPYMFKFTSSISLKFLHFTVYLFNHQIIHIISITFWNHLETMLCGPMISNVEMLKCTFSIYFYTAYTLNRIADCILCQPSRCFISYEVVWQYIHIYVVCTTYTQTHLLYSKLVLYIFFSHFIIILKKQIEIVMKAIVRKMWTLKKTDVSALFL